MKQIIKEKSKSVYSLDGVSAFTTLLLLHTNRYLTKKFLQLPSIETLRKYTHFTTAQTGFNPEVIARLVTDANLANLDTKGKQVRTVLT